LTDRDISRVMREMSTDHCTRIRYAFRGIALVLASMEGYASRNAMNPDDRSYLDLARAYLHHDWATTVVAFEFFWSGLIERRNSVNDIQISGGLPETVLWLLGYPFFIWLSVGSLISMVNPDLVVTTVVVLIAGVLIRIHGSSGSAWHLHFVLGVLLGIGYLAKAVMFPAGFLFVAATFRSQGQKSRWVQPVVVALIFLAVCAPQIIVLSRAKGRFTFADTGKLAYACYTYHLPVRNWQGSPTSGTPVHPTRKLHENPDVFEYNGPIRGSYPPWQDPSYWNEGIRPAFSSSQVAQHVRKDVKESLGTLLQPKYWICGMLLIVLGAAPKKSARAIGDRWFLIVPALLVLAMYAVTFVAFRYFPPWILLLWSAFLLV
jgi:hypothetical protein